MVAGHTGADAIRDALERQGYSVDESAHIIGCGRTKIFDLIREGRLRIVKIGARTIVPRGEIERLMAGDRNGQ